MTLSLVPRREETIEGAGEDLRAGRITCVGLVERCLAAIEEWEPKVHAWVIVCAESALRHARALDRLFAEGTDLGPLHGIPIGVKDIIDVRSLPTKAGAQRWSTEPAEQDARIVRNLQLAGAVVLGKTATTAYAFLDPAITRNPWNLDRTPGGSSSGSAAAVATGMCLAAIGTQTVGSLIRPASYCGIAGFKPVRPYDHLLFDGIMPLPWKPLRPCDRFLLDGIVPLAPSLDMFGFLARSIRGLIDLERASVYLPKRDEESPTDEPRDPPKIAVLRGQFDDKADSSMKRAMLKTLSICRDAGAEIVEVDLSDSFERIWGALRSVLAAEVADFHGQRFSIDPDDYPARIASLIREGEGVRATEYIAARRLMEESRFSDFGDAFRADVLVCPAATGPAPGIELTGDAVFNAPWSFLNRPTLTLPIGLAPDGLPLGIQLIDPEGEGFAVLATALWLERVLQDALSSERG